MRSFFRAVTVVLVVALAAPALAQDRVKSKEIVIGLGAEPRTMLAVTIVDWTTNNMLEHIYDRLLDRDPKTFKPVPMLATSYKIVNDTTWEFTLRKGVKFHNGEPFTAQSVKATLDYALDPASKSHYATASYWWPRSPSAPGRSSSSSGDATSDSSSSAIPTTGAAPPTRAA